MNEWIWMSRLFFTCISVSFKCLEMYQESIGYITHLNSTSGYIQDVVKLKVNSIVNLTFCSMWPIISNQLLININFYFYMPFDSG